MSSLPLVEELSQVPDVLEALRAVQHLPNVLLFESVLLRPQLGRYSFLTGDPFARVVLEKAEFGVDPFADLRTLQQRFASETVAELPPFQGGIAGLLSYELGHAWERLPVVLHDEFEMPSLVVGVYDWVIAWDHEQHRAWIISHGFSTKGVKQNNLAADRIAMVKDCLRNDASRPPVVSQSETPRKIESLFPALGVTDLYSNFSREGYLRAVEEVIENIVAGEIFQANLSQQLLAPQTATPLELYAILRESNPATFGGYFAHNDWAVLSSSPERFVSLQGDEVETRPIKGTRQRQRSPEADLYTGDVLRESEKDNAENVMIVDLLRNDLSRVCRPHSIHVPDLCQLETYETVQHLVSEIRGTLQSDVTAWDLWRAVFPGGSITGAPKVRAMEIITELEQHARGAYCGSLFYLGFDGTLDSNILIRTMTCRRGWVQCPVGGGIVSDSDPVSEYEETIHKAEGMLRALERSRRD